MSNDDDMVSLTVNVAVKPENVPASAVNADRAQGDFKVPADPFARARANTKAEERIGKVGLVRYSTEKR